VKELLSHLMNFISNLDIQVLQGDMVLEIRNAGIDKEWLPCTGWPNNHQNLSWQWVTTRQMKTSSA
jgi:hypothetical protein